MTRKLTYSFSGFVAAAAIACVFVLPEMVSFAAADEHLYSVSRGGRLYDNWHLENREPVPDKPHPAYPADKAYADDPVVNWRCKECHGWDYKGASGVYAKGSHATGIKGIDGMAEIAPDKIIAVLKDATHAYNGLMREEDFRDLANFVSGGQIDMYRYIDSKTNRADGDPVLRESFYQSICSGCHGMDGFRLRTIPPLGDVARSDPWKSLHMIINGHADEKMPSLRAFDLQVLVGILAYVQTLPSGTAAASLVRGGRLYDDWRRESDFYFSAFPGSLAIAFDRRHPAYPIDKKYAKNPEVNWRCKECHGWDYKGASGAYGTGKHYTGIKGIRDMVGVPPDRIVAILKDASHQYGNILDYRDLQDLANFVSRGQIDMDRYIDRATLKAKGDPARSKVYFTTFCATCHGLEGADIITSAPLGQLARQNPWEVLHKMISGHPDEVMPAMRVLGEDILADILAYLQTLPQDR
ncbi:MAG: hypothetical protein ACTSVG_12520 [Alphaproteobacteria bacterium]